MSMEQPESVCSSLEIEKNKPIVEYWGHSQANVHEINYTWTIYNFSFLEFDRGKLLKSPIFYSEDDKQTKWTLNLCPNGINKSEEPFLSIYLGSDNNELEVIVKFEISILNSQLKKNITKRSIAARKFAKNQDTLGFSKFVEKKILLESEDLLLDDKLIIFCKISYFCENEIISISGQEKMDQFNVPECNVRNDFGNLFANGNFSDVTLVVGDQKVPAHKAILSARSDVFAAMFEHEMKESKLNLVNIVDVDHEVLHEMLLYIYTGEAPNIKGMADRLLVAADKYALKTLKVMCEKAIFSELSIETAIEILILADLYKADQLKEQTITFINSSAKNIFKTKGWENLLSTKDNLSVVALLFEKMMLS